MPLEDERSFSIPVLKVKQPIGEFFIGVMDAERLCEITDFDVRRLIRERDFERYLGIQRPLDAKRVKEIKQYVTTLDACFPTSVILSVRADCANYDENSGKLTFSNFMDPEDPERSVLYRQIARVIDGQHRIEGLKDSKDAVFQINISVFVDIDVSLEGYIFSTVNLAQTKVNRSLAFDLFELAKSRSPQKLCHNTAVALDRDEKSAFYKSIKRLGVATDGRFYETITQATFVESLMRYVSRDPMKDRDIYLRGGTPTKASVEESKTLIFRNMFIDNRDLEIVDVLWNYFEAVRTRWQTAWGSRARGDMLNKTNGFRALMRFLRPAYLSIVKNVGEVPNKAQFDAIFGQMRLEDVNFKIENYPAGTSGEAALYKAFITSSGLVDRSK
ncbi:MAG: DGQHR domain-containing protein [Terracidiphilus sp.]